MNKQTTRGDGDWMRQAFMGLTGAPSDYENRKLGRTETDGLIISTCWTDDFGYETAILDRAGAHPVERYETRDAALAGHNQWVKKSTGLKHVTKLGTPDGLIDDEIIDLLRANQ